MQAAAIVMSDAVRAGLREALQRGYVAAYRWLGNADESRDACQEAAARALAASASFDPTRPFYPWFHRILKNHCLDVLAGRQRTVLSDVVPEPPASDGDAHAETHALQAERAHAVARAIAALDPDLREILELRHFQDASYEEMAEILDLPAGTVMSRLYRARKALRAALIADGAAVTLRGAP